MTTYYLIRHGSTDFIGHALSGRLEGVHLKEEGKNQADVVANNLKGVPLRALYSSPIERALETAEPVARRFGLNIEINTSFIELDFGNWSGQSFSELHSDSHWQRFNRFRSGTATPGGELILDVQSRAVKELERLRHLHPEQAIAIVSHADVIRAVIGHFAGIPIDLLQRLEIAPGSISVVFLSDEGPRILGMNWLASV